MKGKKENKMANFRRNPNTQYVSWFLDMMDARRLNLDPPYQRRSVWSLEYKKFFIDTVIRNYPTQAIFLEAKTSEGGRTEYLVLDGKQRLTSLIEFQNGEFETPESLADLGMSGMYWSDLPGDVQTSFMEYLVNVEQLPGASEAELSNIFDRLNRNVQRLNSQELRNARFGGAFIRSMEEKALDSFWEDIGLVTAARRRRMLDVEYISELYVVCMSGIQDGKSYLDKIYADNEEEIDGREQADKLYSSAVKMLHDINDIYPLRGSRLANVADLYSLWSALIDIIKSGEKIDSDMAADQLRDFTSRFDTDEKFEEYRLAARQGSNKRRNRIARSEVLKGVLMNARR